MQDERAHFVAWGSLDQADVQAVGEGIVRKRKAVWNRTLCNCLLATAGFASVACEPKERVLPRLDLSDAGQESTSDNGSESAPAPTEQEIPLAELGTESPPSVGGLNPSAVTGQSGEGTGPTSTSDAGPNAGDVTSVCKPMGPRDCTSEFDNDCDGQADNTIDDVCRCVPTTVETCDEHLGLDGVGHCRAGARTCLGSGGNATSDWAACEGAVGPGDQDSCSVAGDDTDCDGLPNEGCGCVDGEAQPCGSSTDTGVCQIGTSTCLNGAFGPCAGAVAPATRDACTPADDANCNGIPNEGCGCIDGETRSCGSDVGNCTVGTQACVNGTFSGQCVGAAGPNARDSCSVAGDDANCNGIPNEGCGCIDGETRPCGTTDVGNCTFGTQSCVNGAFGQCAGAVDPGSRNCGSPMDNDCDGRPDNTIDNVCQCVIGTTQACGTHPEDGFGSCRAGTQQCQAGPSNSSSTLGVCAGSVGPAPQDSCAAEGNDANCNGIPNDECGCIVGQGNTACRDDPNNSRCNAQGQCVPCDGDADCTLVAGDRQLCGSGQCVASSVIATWAITGNGFSLPSTSTAPGVAGLALTQAAIFDDVTPPLQNTIAPLDWPRNEQSIDLERYLEFGVTLDAGASATYEHLEFAVSCLFCENASANWQIRSSVDNFATIVANGSLGSVLPPALVTPSVRSLGTRGGTVRFRLYMFNIEAPSEAGPGQTSPIVGLTGGAQGASLSIFAGLL